MVMMMIVMMDLLLVADELNRPLVKRDRRKNGDDNDNDDYLYHDKDYDDDHVDNLGADDDA